MSAATSGMFTAFLPWGQKCDASIVLSAQSLCCYMPSQPDARFRGLPHKGKRKGSPFLPSVSNLAHSLSSVSPSALTLVIPWPHLLHSTVKMALLPLHNDWESELSEETMATERINFCPCLNTQSCSLSTVQKITHTRHGSVITYR